MHSQDTSNPKVVSIFATRVKSKEAAPSSSEQEPGENPENFSDVMKQNQKNKERMERERLNANKSVLRSYRIKH